MNNSLDFTSRLAIDSKSIDDLQLLSKQDSKQALQEAAKQFEALFLQMLVKSMRDATLKSGLIDSQQTQFYTEMYDQQLAQTMSAKGIGLADIMVDQLTRTYHDPEQTAHFTNQTKAENPTKSTFIVQSSNNRDIQTTNNHNFHQKDSKTTFNLSDSNNFATNQATAKVDISSQLWPDNMAEISALIRTHTVNEEERVSLSVAPTNKAITKASNKTADFINTLLPHANQVSESTGIPAQFMLAQAALESGWGKYEIRHADNSPSHNLFGIKAGSNWTGNIVETVTTEYINGIPQKMVEKFRAYSSYEEGFQDYANLLSNNPRYAEVLNTQNASDFANGLQRAGYATDPQYADKLLRILNNSVLYNQESI